MRGHSRKEGGSIRYSIGKNSNEYRIGSGMRDGLAQRQDRCYAAIKDLLTVHIQREARGITNGNRADGGRVDVDLHLHLRQVQHLDERTTGRATDGTIDGRNCAIMWRFEHGIVQVVL